MPKQSGEAQYQEPAFMGKALAVDEKNFPTSFQWKPKFVTSIVDLTITADQSGTYFLNTAATEAEINFTLPAIATGPWIFHFVAIAATAVKVTAAAADTMLAFNDSGADSVSFETASEIMGNMFSVLCDGTTVMAIASGTGTLTVGT